MILQSVFIHIHPSNDVCILILLHKVIVSVSFGRYNIEGQFSLAVNISEDQDLNKLEKVFEKDLFHCNRKGFEG